MSTPLHNRLYLRIWLAVVLAIALVAVVAGWLGRQEAERERAQRPAREVTIRSSAGEVLGQAVARPSVVPGQGAEFQVDMKDGSTLFVQLARAPRAGGPQADGERPPRMGPPRPPPPLRLPFSFFWLMVFLAVAVALGAYPIVRRLTHRLEVVQAGVQRWGDGDLAYRLPQDGKDEVAYLARQFNQSAQQIEQLLASQQALLASQKSLLANASHELRSPLARIRMGLELMQTGGAEARADMSREITRNIAELDQLIEEILLASRLDAKEADLGSVETLDLVALAAEEGARVRAQLDSLADPQALLVRGVGKLLRRALRNLLENARRHAGRDVWVQLTREGSWVLVRVQDDGPGVPLAHRDRVFEAFFRLPGASERDGGVGLGLALVKSIAARHGGTVTCAERPGGGASFELRLPAIV
ncbi:MAG: hypothetical protein RLZZ126_290 [Pseudomonadota bacterium]|jgi:signal transduction histidine kinase